MRFTGEQSDAKARPSQGGKDVRLYYLRARYYDRASGGPAFALLASVIASCSEQR